MPRFANFGRLPCYNGGLSNPGTAEHDETIAVARRRFAGVLLRRGGRGTRADGHSEHSILRARGTLTFHQLRLRFRSSPTASVEPMLGGLVGCTSASAEPLHAAQKSAARLQLRNYTSVNATLALNPIALLSHSWDICISKFFSHSHLISGNGMESGWKITCISCDSQHIKKYLLSRLQST